MLLLPVLAIVAGFALLVWGADRFVAGASATARNLGVSPIIIGLTIVGFGTSAPEMLVSAMAAWDGSPEMGVGNAIGSNVTNIGLVLGVTALVAPLAVRSETLRREFPVLFVIMLLALTLAADGDLTRIDGIILLAAMGLMLYWMVGLGLKERAGGNGDPLAAEYAEEIPQHMPTTLALLWVVVGIAVLLGSSRLAVWGSVEIARWAGVSELVIGLTVIALGTSLPELAASVMSALKGEHDIAIGNVLGSNMFNLLAVFGMPALIAPHTTPAAVLSRDFPVMFTLSVALFAMAYGFRKPGQVTRPEGLLLVTAYCAYTALLYTQRAA